MRPEHRAGRKLTGRTSCDNIKKCKGSINIAFHPSPCYIFAPRCLCILDERTFTMRMDRCVSLLIVAAVLVVGESSSLPRFASRTGARCQSCHINPSGGAMRQAFGVQYGREQLPVPEWSKDFEMEDFTNLVANVLGVGADFRTLYFYQQRDSTQDNAFFQMQGDIYLNFRVAKKVNLFLKKGLRSGFEVFGLLNILPASGHVKIGKFVPGFGT